jgi:hypothetical protein
MKRSSSIAQTILDAAKRGQRRSIAGWAEHLGRSYNGIYNAVTREGLQDLMAHAYTATESVLSVATKPGGKQPRTFIGSSLLRGAGLEAEQLLQARVVGNTIVLSKLSTQSSAPSTHGPSPKAHGPEVTHV